jgi:ubiquitin C-terminal hydrolase
MSSEQQEKITATSNLTQYTNDEAQTNQSLNDLSIIPLPPAFSKLTNAVDYSNLLDQNLSHTSSSNNKNEKRDNDSTYPSDYISNPSQSIRKYSGLSNQGSTCYLNSLLQSLFMTPEFRLNILNWKYDESNHGAKNDCIPYQLQKLFARLQLKSRTAEETRALTKSFQWDSSEVFHQHDIQELCRKLFEAIEVTMGIGEENFINELYEGNSKSVVKCQVCPYKSEKSDKFLDITLPIRNDFDKIYNNSLGMALCNFLKPEILEKDNQYFCENCNSKVDASKYIQFTKMPKILIHIPIKI